MVHGVAETRAAQRVQAQQAAVLGRLIDIGCGLLLAGVVAGVTVVDHHGGGCVSGQAAETVQPLEGAQAWQRRLRGPRRGCFCRRLIADENVGERRGQLHAAERCGHRLQRGFALGQLQALLGLPDQQVDRCLLPDMRVASRRRTAIDPVHVHRVHRAGQGDVEQAQALLQFLAEVSAAVLGEGDRAQVHAAPAAGVVVAQQLRRVDAVAAADAPRQRQEDDREFQPLAGVDGEQLHPARIALDAQLALVGGFGIAVGAFLAHLPQPRVEAIQALPRAFFRGQQFAQVAQVGEHAFAFGQRQQGGGANGQQGLDQSQHAAVA